MKKRKINKIISTSIASSLIMGAVSENINIVFASEVIAEDSQIENKEKTDDFLEIEFKQTTSSAIEIEEVEDDDINALPQGFSSNNIGNESENSFASYEESTKTFEVKGTGTYIGKDVNATDDYHFVNYKVEGDATIIARLVDFDMSNAQYGQAGVFIRDDNTSVDSDYFGVYVEPSKNQYRYAYRGNSKSGAAQINGLDSSSKEKYIKIVKTGNSFRYYISDNENFEGDNVLTNSQTINNDDDTWYVGFVVSNGTNNSEETIAHFDNVIIKNENEVLYSSNPKEDNEDSVIETKEEALQLTTVPDSTVYSKNVEFSGNVTQDGVVKVLLNGELVDKELSLNSDDSFNYKLSLINGRNSIEIYHTNKDNEISSVKYSVLCIDNMTYDIIVDSNYNSESINEADGVVVYKTIQEAVSSISTKNTERKVIFIKNGTYKEKLTIESPYISLIGEDKDKTIITYDAANGTINPETGIKYGTSKSASVYVKSKAFGFTAENLTIENSFIEKGNENEQAVAFNNEADQSSLINCKLVGNQDTLLANASSSKPARQYYYKCEIQGDVDFIFGRAQAVFNDCDIISLNRKSSTNNGYITASNAWNKDSYGYLVINSRLLGEEGIADNSVSLGRPWRPSSATEKVTPAVTYVNCFMGSHITNKGWEDMGKDSLAADSRFYEYGSYGPGAVNSETRTQLTEADMVNYSIDNLFASNSAATNYAINWNPHNTEDTLINISIDSLYKFNTTETPEVPEESVPETPETPEVPEESIPEIPETPEVPEENDKPIVKPGLENPDYELELTSKNWVKNSDKTLSLVYNGEKLTGWHKVGTSWYYLNEEGIMQTGLIEFDNNKYYLKSNGVMQTGWVSYKINNISYKNYFNEDGTMQVGWITEKKNTYYINEDGSKATGWMNIDDKWYYFKSNGSMQSGWLKISDDRYFLNSDGAMQTGWYTDEKKNRTYYLKEDGIAAVGFYEIDGATYYFKSDGTMVTGWLSYKSNNQTNKYYFNENGKLQTGWLNIKNKSYYLQEDGLMTKGWYTIDGKWYYFKSDGTMVKNKTVDGHKIDSNGVASSKK